MDYLKNIANSKFGVNGEHYITDRQESPSIFDSPVDLVSKTNGRNVQAGTVKEVAKGVLEAPECQDDLAELIMVAAAAGNTCKVTKSYHVVETEIGSQNDSAVILKKVEPQQTILDLEKKSYVEQTKCQNGLAQAVDVPESEGNACAERESITNKQINPAGTGNVPFTGEISRPEGELGKWATPETYAIGSVELASLPEANFEVEQSENERAVVYKQNSGELASHFYKMSKPTCSKPKNMSADCMPVENVHSKSIRGLSGGQGRCKKYIPNNTDKNKTAFKYVSGKNKHSEFSFINAGRALREINCSLQNMSKLGSVSQEDSISSTGVSSAAFLPACVVATQSLVRRSGSSEKTGSESSIPDAKRIPTHIAMKIEEYKRLPLEMITMGHIKKLKRWDKIFITRNKEINTHTHGKDEPTEHSASKPRTVVGGPFIPGFVIEKLEKLKQLPIEMITTAQRRAINKWQSLVDRKNRIENHQVMIRNQHIASHSMKRFHKDEDSVKNVPKKPRTETSLSSGLLTGVVDEVAEPPVNNPPKLCNMKDVEKKLSKLKRYSKLTNNQKKMMDLLQKVVDAASKSQEPARPLDELNGSMDNIPKPEADKSTEDICSSVEASTALVFDESSVTYQLCSVKRTTPLQLDGCIKNVLKFGGNTIDSVENSVCVFAMSTDTYIQPGFVNATEAFQKLGNCKENIPEPSGNLSEEDGGASIQSSAVHVSAKLADTYSKLGFVGIAGPLQEVSGFIENILRSAEQIHAEGDSNSTEKSAVYIPSNSADTYYQFDFANAAEPFQRVDGCIQDIQKPSAGPSKDGSSSVESSVVAISANPSDTYSQPGFEKAARSLEGIGSCIHDISKPVEYTSTQDAGSSVGTSTESVPVKLADTYPDLGLVEESGQIQELDSCIEDISKPAEDTSTQGLGISVGTSVKSVSTKLADTHHNLGFVKESGLSPEFDSFIEDILKPAEHISAGGAGSSVGTSAESVSSKPADTYPELDSMNKSKLIQKLDSYIQDISKPADDTSTQGEGSSARTSKESVPAKLADMYPELGFVKESGLIQELDCGIENISKPTEDTSTQGAGSSVGTSTESIFANSVDTYPELNPVEESEMTQGLVNCIEDISKPTGGVSTQGADSSVGTSTESVSAKPAGTYPVLDSVKKSELIQELDSCIEDISKPADDTSTQGAGSSVGMATESVSAKTEELNPLDVSEQLRIFNSSVESESKPVQNKIEKGSITFSSKVQVRATPRPAEYITSAESIQSTTTEEDISKPAKVAGNSAGISVVPFSTKLAEFRLMKAARKLQEERSYADTLSNRTNSLSMSDAEIAPTISKSMVDSANIFSQFSFVKAFRQLQLERSSDSPSNPTNSESTVGTSRPLETSMSSVGEHSRVRDQIVKIDKPFSEASTCTEKASKSILCKPVETATSSGIKPIREISAKRARKVLDTNIAGRITDQTLLQKQNQGRKRSHDADIKRQRFKKPLYPLRVAIVDMRYPEVILTRDQSDLIESELADLLVKSKTFCRVLPLQFYNCSFAGGVLWACCANENTKTWLKDSVNCMSSFWDGLQLKAVDEVDLPKRPKVMVFIPGQGAPLDEFLARLDRQNPGLTASNWLLIGRKTEEGRGITVAFSIDNNSYDLLENNDWTVSYKKSKIRCRKLNKISDMWMSASCSKQQNVASSSSTVRKKHTHKEKVEGYHLSWRNAQLKYKHSRNNKRHSNRGGSSHYAQELPNDGYFKF